MKIGIDLDDTIFQNKNLANLIESYGFERPKLWGFKDFEIKPDNDSEELMNEMGNYIHEMFTDPEFMCNDNLIPFEKSIETINKMINDGHEVVIITARTKNIRNKTIELVHKYLPNVSVKFVELGESKEECFRKENIHLWIDDSPHDILTAKKLGIKTILISNEKTLYNHDVRINSDYWINSIKDIDMKWLI